MGFFSSDSHDQVYGDQHEGQLSHEVLAGGAAFEAMRTYEKHQDANGKPENHQLAKELVAGFAGAEVDKLFETKGLDYLDREKAKRQAQDEATQAYDQQYGN